jgi:hypothetical protein
VSLRVARDGGTKCECVAIRMLCGFVVCAIYDHRQAMGMSGLILVNCRPFVPGVLYVVQLPTRLPGDWAAHVSAERWLSG